MRLFGGMAFEISVPFASVLVVAQGADNDGSKGIAMAFSAWMGFLIPAAWSRINGNSMNEGENIAPDRNTDQEADEDGRHRRQMFWILLRLIKRTYPLTTNSTSTNAGFRLRLV